jgi:hypothetical protein
MNSAPYTMLEVLSVYGHFLLLLGETKDTKKQRNLSSYGTNSAVSHFEGFVFLWAFCIIGNLGKNKLQTLK